MLKLRGTTGLGAEGLPLFLINAAAVFLAAAMFALPLVNPDLFWHLSAGRWIAEHRALPAADWLSWTMEGRAWYDFEWLSQLLYYALYSWKGYWGLFWLKAPLLTGALLPLAGAARLHGNGATLFAVLPAAAAAMVTNSDARPENFSVFFFSLLFLRLEALRVSSSAPSGYGALYGPAACFAGFALWANLHAGFAYGLALILLFAAGDAAAQLLPRVYGIPAPFDRSKPLAYLGMAAAGLAGTLANPYGPKLYLVLADHSRHMRALSDFIQEWKPFELAQPYHWAFAALFFLAFLHLLISFLRTRRVSFEHLFALLFFGWAAVTHARHAPFFCLAAGFYLAASWKPAAEGPRRRPQLLARLLLFAGALAYARLYVWPEMTSMPARFPMASEGLARYLEARAPELSRLRMYNFWGWGGFLGWRLAPAGYKVFLDGRYLFHPLLEETELAPSDLGRWKAMMGKYRFGLAVIERSPARVQVRQKMRDGREALLSRPAYLLYFPKKDWATVYWDRAGVVLARRSELPPSFLKSSEFSLVRPDDMGNLAAAVLAGDAFLSAAAAEIERYARSAPPSPENVSADLERWLASLKEACARSGKCGK